ncbi:hypothetical protein BO71DRAFT_316048 [Aspergillus ellipticus CBS 707.79]|uniref:Rhodopsin domain-containing protein n=1 Tax=Aspergillus ellipticus CBS 707.79 TaxID=1448320 RepID=A0A319DM13_9EURO|nr:hypothetical protein BO71DRAFT_316048 [Aspergillus ellipticus CBS 707.79]
MTITVRIIVLALAIPTTLVCGLRPYLYLRRFVVNQFGLDDWLVLGGLVGVDLFSALAYTITYYGLGMPLTEVSAEDLLEYASQCAYLVIAANVKTSLLIFIMRLFPTRLINIVGKSLLVFTAAFTLSGTLALVFQCNPIRAVYDTTISDSTCYPTETSYSILMLQVVIMFVLDVTILLLPMRSIWQLQMPIRKRLLTLGLLCVGFIACIAALVRFSTLRFANDTTNFTYSASTSLIWMEIEFNLGLMSGSLSSLRKLFKIRSQFLSSNTTLSASNHTGNFELPGQTWSKGGITKKTEIKRVCEISESQEHIAPIYGQGELTTTTEAYAAGERGSVI